MMNRHAILVVVHLTPGALAQPSFELFDQLTPQGISRDGRFVVGYRVVSGTNRAAIWDRQLGTVRTLGSLPTVGTAWSRAYAVSDDGRFVVGQSTADIGEQEAFRYDAETDEMIGLGDLQQGLGASIALGVSADGRVIVGRGFHVDGSEAFRWENGVMMGLGDFEGGAFRSEATAISADGATIVGWGSVTVQGIPSERPFVWRDGHMMALQLTCPPTAQYCSGIAWGVNADGAIIVGQNQGKAVRWYKRELQLLGHVGNDADWVAHFVTYDGKRILGELYAGPEYPVLWDQGIGARHFNSVLRDLGLNASAGPVAGLSADGGVVLGRSGSYGYIAQLQVIGPSDTDADGVPDSQDACPRTIPGVPVDLAGCPPQLPGDMDRDGDVDLVDYAIWQRCMGGTDVPSDPACNTTP